MSKIERDKRLLRRQLAATSKREPAQATRVLRDDELDAVSGGYTLRNCMISSD